jgi:hypothetical protein
VVKEVMRKACKNSLRRATGHWLDLPANGGGGCPPTTEKLASGMKKD